jgi:hypothetical protein
MRWKLTIQSIVIYLIWLTETDRVAKSVDEPAIRMRLHAIAGELRNWAFFLPA